MTSTDSVLECAPIAASSPVFRVFFTLVSAVIGATSLAQTPAPTPAQAPPAAQGQGDNQLAVWAGYGDSDNIGRSATPESGTYRSVGLFLGLERQASRLDADINSDIEYRNYVEDVLDEETVGSLDARALVDMVEDRFSWNFQGSIDQGQQDPFAARGPNNRETIKYFTTGPLLDIPFGRTSLVAGASRRANRHEESTQVDNNTDDYRLTLSRQARPTTLFALGASSIETDYLDGVAPSYRIDQLFVRVNKTLRRGSLTADVGTNEIGSEGDSRRDPLLDFAWNRSLGTRSSLAVTATQGFTNSGETGSGGTTLITVAPFEQKSAGTTYTLGRDRTTVTMAFSAGDEDYAGGVALDNSYESVNLMIAYRTSPRLAFGLLYDRYDREYEDSAASTAAFEDQTYGIWLNRTLGRRFSVALDVSRYKATGTSPIQETRTEIRFAYSPTGSTSAALGSIGR